MELAFVAEPGAVAALHALTKAATFAQTVWARRIFNGEQATGAHIGRPTAVQRATKNHRVGKLATFATCGLCHTSGTQCVHVAQTVRRVRGGTCVARSSVLLRT